MFFLLKKHFLCEQKTEHLMRKVSEKSVTWCTPPAARRMHRYHRDRIVRIVRIVRVVLGTFWRRPPSSTFTCSGREGWNSGGGGGACPSQHLVWRDAVGKITAVGSWKVDTLGCDAANSEGACHIIYAGMGYEGRFHTWNMSR